MRDQNLVNALTNRPVKRCSNMFMRLRSASSWYLSTTPMPTLAEADKVQKAPDGRTHEQAQSQPAAKLHVNQSSPSPVADAEIRPSAIMSPHK